jgi:ribosomal protein L16/L10AE
LEGLVKEVKQGKVLLEEDGDDEEGAKEGSS